MSKQPSSATNLSKFQRFENVTIHRNEIKNAPYNPRVIDKHARKKLKDKIKKIGLVGTLTWNKRSGNLVGGHQRLSILDELEGTQDYTLTVSAVDMDDKTEKEMNVFLNNTVTQGNFDLDLLGELINDKSLDIAAFGFDNLDLQMMFDDNDTLGSFFDEKKDNAAVDIEKIEKMKKGRKDYRDSVKDKDDAVFCLHIVFQSQKQLDSFLDKTLTPRNERYLDGQRFISLVGMTQ